jgi:VWFA-related protein
MRGGHAVWASVLLAWMAGMSAHAQSPADQPTFRAGTTLIEFTVVVTDADGRPVADLTQPEISIIESGRPREAAFFHYEGAPPTAIRVRAQALPPGIYTNRPEYAPGPPRNIVAIVIDALNTRSEDQVRVLAQILAFIAAIPQDSRVAIYRTGERVHIIHDFTDDLEGLRSRLRKGALEAPRRTQAGVEAEQPQVEKWQADVMTATMEASTEMAYEELARVEEQSNQQALTRRHDFTMASLEAVGNHLAAIPGRKNLIWMTSGVPMMSVGSRDPWPENYESALRRVAQRLASQGISMYPVEPTGIRPPYLNVNAGAKGSTRGVEDSIAAAAASDAIGRAAARVDARAAARGQPLGLQRIIAGPGADVRSIASASDLFADLTGGRTFRNTNDLLAGVKAAAEDLRGTYSIGFYVPHEPDERWHTFDVRVARSNVKVVHRQGYLSSAAVKHSELWLADQWRAAAANPLGSSGVRLDARFELKDNTLYSIVQIPGEDLHFVTVKGAPTCELEVAIAERTAQGLLGIRHEQGSFSIQESQAGNLGDVTVRFRKDWKLDPKTSLIRIVIRDRHTGHYGTLDVPIAALR